MLPRPPAVPPRPRAPALATLLAITAGTAVASGCATISPEQEREIGADYARQIEAELPMVDDGNLNAYVNQLGRRIAAGTTRGFDYRFRIVNAEPINAFALPGGYVYINRGVVDAADNLMELAGVLAHEIGHVEERHSAEQIERAQSANLGVNLAYILIGRNPGAVEQAAVGVGGGLVLARYSRQAEEEADEVAISLLVEAGIHPRGLLTFFQEMLEQQRRSPNAVEAWFSTHPTTEDRIAQTRARLDRIPESRLRGLETDDAAFRSFKARMAQYTAPPPEYRNRR